MLGRLQSLLDVLFRRRRFEHGMADEMRFHIEAFTDDLIASGLSRDEATRRARLEFGSVESAKEESRAARGLHWVDELRQNVHFAARQMWRTPTVTFAVVTSLALGIGANTAIFSLMDAVLFRTLPLAAPERLYFLAHTGLRQQTASNYPLYERYKALAVFSGVTTYARQEITLTTADGVERINGQFVSGNFHAVLGVPMAHGRGFSSEVDRAVGSSMIAVISDDYWSRKYGRSPDVLGKQVTIGGRSLSIVGVTAPGFDGLIPGHKIDITLPMSVRAMSNQRFFDARDTWTSLNLVARLADNVSETQALTVVDAAFKQFWAEPQNAWARGPNSPTRPSGLLLPADKGDDFLRKDYTVPLRVLMGMVGLVLIIACANVANLLLARASARAREVAVRMSMGASRARLVRQFLTETVMLAFAGGSLGLLVAVGGSRFIAALLATGRSPVVLDVDVNPPVLLFALGVSLATGIGFGLVPALRATRIDLTPTLKEGGTSGLSRRRLTTGKALVVAQIALCALVIAVAGLLTRTLTNLKQFDAGFDRENMLLFNLEAPRLAEAPRQAFYDGIQQRLRALPGVVAVAYSARSPVDFSMNSRRIDVPDSRASAANGVSAIIVSPEYFGLFGMRLLRGRGLAADDRSTSAAVVVINEAMARHFYGEADPIGRTVFLGADRNQLTIVGVVQNAREKQLRDEAPMSVYTPVAQTPVDADGGGGIPRRVTVEMLTTGDPVAQAAAVRREVRASSREAVLTYVRTMEQQVGAAIVRERLLASVSAGFGILAMLLAVVGLYGTMSYGVARRSREIALRIALGATQAMMQWRTVGETVALATIGVVIGLTAALATTRVVSSFLFGLSARDPATLAGVAGLLLAIAFAAGLIPGRRAASIDPMQTLRSE